MRVIAVDDEKLSLMKIERILKEIPGIEFVAGYKNPAQALLHQQEDAADLAFLDIEMPEIDGLFLSERLMEQNPNLEVVFVTAHERYALAAYQTNAIGYLLKPVQMEDIQAQISRVQRYKKPTSAKRAQHAQLYFKVFGPFFVKLAQDESDMLKFRTEKSEELLALLLNQRGKPIARDVICDMLWPDMDQEKAIRNFHTTAYNIRHTCNEAGLKDVLLRVHDSYRLNPACTQSELDLFCAAIDQVKKGILDAAAIENALAAYEGVYMANKDYLWLSDYQRYYEQQFESLALGLCDEYLKSKSYSKAEAILKKLLKQNAICEDACERLVSLHLSNGRREEALRVYQEFKKIFFNEMGEEPGERLRKCSETA